MVIMLTRCGQSAGKTKMHPYSITHELAYVAGVYLGDGCVVFSTKYRNYYFALNATDKDFVQETARCVGKVLEKDVPIFEDKWHRDRGNYPLFKTVAYGKDFAGWLHRSCHGKNRIPKWIKTASRDIKLAFVAGVMDSEGSVWNFGQRLDGKPKGTSVSFYNSEPWRKGFIKLIEKLGVVVLRVRKKPKWNGSKRHTRCYDFNMISFVTSGCYFKIERKQRILRDWISRILLPSETTR